MVSGGVWTLLLYFREVKLADPDVVSNPSEYQKLAKSMAELDEVVSTYGEFKDCEKQLEETKDLAKDSGGDEDMAEMIASEISALTNQLEKLEDKLKLSFAVRAGTGGDEAGLWAGDLVGSSYRGIVNATLGSTPQFHLQREKGGFKTFVMEIKGNHVYSKLKYESGVHRVPRQRHKADEVEVVIDPKDIELTTARSGGAGGKWISYSPYCLAAMIYSAYKRYEIKVKEQQEMIRNQRKSQVGTGARAEKIRTYNYKDNRVTDHRLKMNFELTSFLDGDIETAVQEMADATERFTNCWLYIPE
ncbi:hypothetical protein Scep_030632 [Stephania cephalantha]|uniref:Peptide chain release factor domain-containing protein n=1 Tax=Stephania cephalantha TaxID=152367 RepID=A0AAP0E050_9MAGN